MTWPTDCKDLSWLSVFVIYFLLSRSSSLSKNYRLFHYSCASSLRPSRVLPLCLRILGSAFLAQSLCYQL